MELKMAKLELEQERRLRLEESSSLESEIEKVVAARKRESSVMGDQLISLENSVKTCKMQLEEACKIRDN